MHFESFSIHLIWYKTPSAGLLYGVEADTFVKNYQTTTEKDETDAFDEFERKSRVKRKT